MLGEVALLALMTAIVPVAACPPELDDVIVDEHLLGRADRLLHRVHLLRDVQTGAFAFDHVDHVAQVPLDPPEALDDF